MKISLSKERSKVCSFKSIALLTVEKIFMQLKKETIDKIKEVPVIKAAYIERTSKIHHKDPKNALKNVKLSAHETLH